MNQPDADHIFHIITNNEWQTYQATGIISPESLRTEGFVHCSTAAQVTATIGRYYAGRSDIRVVEISVALLDSAAEVRWEESRPDEFFPHVYSSIPLAAVVGELSTD